MSDEATADATFEYVWTDGDIASIKCACGEELMVHTFDPVDGPDECDCGRRYILHPSWVEEKTPPQTGGQRR